MQTSNERDIQRYKNCIQKDDPLLVQDAVICKKMQKKAGDMLQDIKVQSISNGN